MRLEKRRLGDSSVLFEGLYDAQCVSVLVSVSDKKREGEEGGGKRIWREVKSLVCATKNSNVVFRYNATLPQWSTHAPKYLHSKYRVSYDVWVG